MGKKTSIRLELKPSYTIETQLGIQEGGPAHKHFTEQCKLHMDKYVPASPALNLAGSVYSTTDMIIYPGPYAHYMWEGKVMGPNIPIIENGEIVGYWSKKPKYYTGADIEYDDSTHPLATSHWPEKMWSVEKEEIEENLENYVRKGCKE